MESTVPAGSVGPAAAPEAIDRGALVRERQEVVCRVETSIRYHRARERAFDWMDRGVKVASIVAGSAAALTFFGESMMGLALTIAVMNAVALAVGLAERARKHASLAQRYCDIAARIAERSVHDFTPTDLRSWDTATRKIEGEEPPTMPAVQAAAQYDYERSIGGDHSWLPIRTSRRVLGHLLPIGPYSKSELQKLSEIMKGR